jgi:hypothetical protein
LERDDDGEDDIAPVATRRQDNHATSETNGESVTLQRKSMQSDKKLQQ